MLRHCFNYFSVAKIGIKYLPAELFSLQVVRDFPKFDMDFGILCAFPYDSVLSVIYSKMLFDLCPDFTAK